jgi:hypothetical protein
MLRKYRCGNVVAISFGDRVALNGLIGRVPFPFARPITLGGLGRQGREHG